MGWWIGMVLAILFWGFFGYLTFIWIVEFFIDRSDRKFKEKVERYPRDIH